MRCALLLACVLACSEPGRSLQQEEFDPSSCELVSDLPIEYSPTLDLLFVIDESPSMADEQASLRVNYVRFIDVLENIEGGLPDVQIGVVSADLARGGMLEGMLYDRLGADGVRERNYPDGALDGAFLALADLGSGGGMFSQPLEAMRLALATPGFVREHAFLAVIFVTDQDDCSAADDAFMANGDLFDCARHGISCGGGPLSSVPASYDGCAPLAPSRTLWPIAEYADFVKGLKLDPRMVVVSAITGNPTPVIVGPGPGLAPSCTSSAGQATPAVRLAGFLNLFPDRNTWVSICNVDASDALQHIAALSACSCGSPCFDAALDATDLAPEMPGLQLDCTVTDTRFPGEPHQTATPIRRCALDDSSQPLPGQPLPCWWAYEDPVTCPTGWSSGVILSVRRGGNQFPPVGTHVIAHCASICSP